MTSIFVKEGGTEQKFEDLNFEELVRSLMKEFPGGRLGVRSTEMGLKNGPSCAFALPGLLGFGLDTVSLPRVGGTWNLCLVWFSAQAPSPPP